MHCAITAHTYRYAMNSYGVKALYEFAFITQSRWLFQGAAQKQRRKTPPAIFDAHLYKIHWKL